MGAPRKNTAKRIIPAKIVYPKPKKRQNKPGVVGAVSEGCCTCPTPSQTGFTVCTSNGVGLALPPANGGPWIPAFNPATGQMVFINGGGL